MEASTPRSPQIPANLLPLSLLLPPPWAPDRLLPCFCPPIQVIHHVLLDECSGLFYAASRENGKVAAFSIDTLKVRAGGLKIAESSIHICVSFWHLVI